MKCFANRQNGGRPQLSFACNNVKVPTHCSGGVKFYCHGFITAVSGEMCPASIHRHRHRSSVGGSLRGGQHERTQRGKNRNSLYFAASRRGEQHGQNRVRRRNASLT